jgi:hypothetical protein
VLQGFAFCLLLFMVEGDMQVAKDRAIESMMQAGVVRCYADASL